MKTIISLLGGIGGVYNVWKELTTTNNDVEVIFLDFSNNANAPDDLKKLGFKTNVERICNMLKQRERDFTLTIKEVDSWTKEPFHGMEMAYIAIEEFKNNTADKLIYHFLKDEESQYTIEIANGMKERLAEMSPSKGTIVVPGVTNNLSKLHALRELPSYIKPYISYCANVNEDGSACGVCVKCTHHLLDMQDYNSNFPSEDFLTKKLNLLGRGPNPFAGTILQSSNGNVTVTDHPIYGTFGGPRTPTNHPFTEVEDKHIFIPD